MNEYNPNSGFNGFKLRRAYKDCSQAKFSMFYFIHVGQLLCIKCIYLNPTSLLLHTRKVWLFLN